MAPATVVMPTAFVEVPQQFAVASDARAIAGTRHGHVHETSDARWVMPADVSRPPINRPIRGGIDEALADDPGPRLE